MSKVNVFAQSRMKSFAGLVSRELGVQVRLRGKQICVKYSKPPVIFLPEMDGAKADDLLPIYGFALHEAAHLRYTDRKVSMGAPNYLVKLIHNAIEDEYIERRLEKDFPGAREMLTRSYIDGIRVIFGDGPFVETHSWIAEESRERVVAEMLRHELDTTNDTLVGDVAKRLEIFRVAKLWILEARGYPLPTYDWPTHPWHSVFTEETTPRARTTQQGFDQASKIIARLGVKPCLPGDARPIIEAEKKKSEAKMRERESADARKAFKRAKRDRNAEVRALCEQTPEATELAKARAAHEASEGAANRANDSLEKITKRLTRAAESTAKQGERVESCRTEAASARARAESVTGDEKTPLEENAARIEERLQRLQAKLDADRQNEQALREQEAQANAKALAADSIAELDEQREASAREAYDEVASGIRKEVGERHAPQIQVLNEEANAKAESAKTAVDFAKKAMGEIEKRDGEVGGEPVAPGAGAKVVAAAWDRFRDQSAGEELSRILSGDETDEAVAHDGKTVMSAKDIKRLLHSALPAPARKYVVLDRSLDRIDRISETPEARAKLDLARSEYAGLIREMKEKLKRLHSPVQTRLKFNTEKGRLDSRKAYKVGLATKGVAVDLNRVWRETTIKPDPKFAVTLLIDCSGSMNSGGSGEAPIAVARKSAAALSEVLRDLSIPHEILGHTALSSGVSDLVKSGEVRAEDFAEYSRITPFHGLVFKAFQENAIPAAVFTDVEMQDNLDGEALLWAAQRLGGRPEKTKLLISISDGLPNTHMACTAELERHLLMTCKTIEACEREGMYLFGIGIGEKRVRNFYKNSDVLESVKDLPRAIMSIVEKVLLGLGGEAGETKAK